MQVQDLIALLSETAAKNEYRFENLRARIPLGVFENGEIATAHREEKPDRYHFALCSGEERREFVLSLVLSLACLYDEREASFLILSPHTDYAALLRLDGADISVPYIRNANDLKEALKLDENSEVLLVSSEGDTDPDRFREITWEGLCGTDKEPFANL